MKIKIVLENDDGSISEIVLGDWTHERNIYIVAGVELAAYKNFNENKLHVKTSRCVQCGKCCLNLPKGQYSLDENNDCVHLDKSGTGKKPCTLSMMRPFPCITGDPIIGKWGKEFCSIRYDGEEK
jgi:hypothetical protein